MCNNKKLSQKYHWCSSSWLKSDHFCRPTSFSVFLVSFFHFYTKPSRSGHFVAYVWNEWLFCDCCVVYRHNFGGWIWTKCHSAYLLPFSLAYIITFNLKPIVYEIAMCSVHILSGEKCSLNLFLFCVSWKWILLSNWSVKWWNFVCLAARMDHCYPPENAGITFVLRSYWQL